MLQHVNGLPLHHSEFLAPCGEYCEHQWPSSFGYLRLQQDFPFLIIQSVQLASIINILNNELLHQIQYLSLINRMFSNIQKFLKLFQ